MKNRIIITILSLALALTALPVHVFAAEKTVFSDVSDTYWGKAYIERAFREGVVGGTYYNEQTGERRYSPAKTLTPVEFSAILFNRFDAKRIKDMQDKNLFSWQHSLQRTVWLYGLVEDGFDNRDKKFTSPMSRYEVARYMVEVLSQKGYINKADYNVEQILRSIPDAKSIPAQYREYVAICRSLGLMSGFSDGSFRGSNIVTRAEAATVYCNISDFVAKTGSPQVKEQIAASVVQVENEQAAQETFKHTDVDLNKVRSEVFRLTNEERTKAGLPALSELSIWNSCADVRAEELSVVFGHTRLDGSSCGTAYTNKPSYVSFGETAAVKTLYAKTSETEIAKAIISNLMNSDSHRAIILKSSFKKLSIGVYAKDVISGNNSVVKVYAIQAFAGEKTGGSGGGNTPPSDVPSPGSAIDNNYTVTFYQDFLDHVTLIKQEGNKYEFSLSLKKGQQYTFFNMPWSSVYQTYASNYNSIAYDATSYIQALETGETWQKYTYCGPGCTGTLEAVLYITVEE